MRVILLIPAVISLILGLSIGLVRFGWEIPLPNYDLLIAHGSLMVCGFFGTLICLERSVVIDRPLAYAVPLLCGIGVATQVSEASHGAGSAFFLLSASGLAITYLCLPGKRDAGFLVQLAGAVAWVVGTASLVSEFPSFVQVPWWMGFLVLTITGERLELSRFRNPSRAAQCVILIVVGVYLAGATTTLAAFVVDASAGIRDTDLGERFGSSLWQWGQGTMSACAIGVAVWLTRYDLARSALKRPGLSRFTAACLLTGYVWLGVSGLIGVLTPGMVGGTMFDARLHSLFLGFVLSMVLGHALIIGPGVFGVAFSFHIGFYAPLVLLHISVALRLISDLRSDYITRSLSGVLTTASVALFVLCMIVARWLAWRTACRKALT